MKKFITTLGIASLVFAAGLTGCESDSGSDNSSSYNQSQLLSDLGEHVILRHYADFSAKMDALNTKATDFNAAPDQPKLDELRVAFKEAYLSWQNVAYFEFGPASSELLLNSTNIFPVDASQVDNNIANGNYDLNSAANISAKGLPAVDYLLYSGSDDNAIITSFTTDSGAANKKSYLADVIADVKDRADKTVSEWGSTTSGYYTDFVAGKGTDIGSSVSLMVNAFNLVFERHVRDGKVGIPSGVRNIVSGNPEPTRVEAFYAEDMSVELAVAALDALEDIMICRDGATDCEGYYDYMDAIGAKKNGTNLSSEVAATIASIKAKLNAINSPLKEEVVNNQAEVQKIFDEMQELVIMLKVDMPAAMSVSIVYLDNDGD